MAGQKHHLLIVDDEPPIRKLLTITFEAHDFAVTEAENGREAVRLAAARKPDLIILDLGLPDMDGLEVLETIRGWSHTPVLVCSARSDDGSVLKAFELGADDYVSKPFNPDILVARVHANLRKSLVEDNSDAALENGQIRMDLMKHEVQIRGNAIDFTPKEYNLLKYFLRNIGKMLTHRQILTEVWGPAHGDDMQYLRVYIGQIREKLERADPDNDYILTEPGIGYRMEAIEKS